MNQLLQPVVLDIDVVLVSGRLPQITAENKTVTIYFQSFLHVRTALVIYNKAQRWNTLPDLTYRELQFIILPL